MATTIQAYFDWAASAPLGEPARQAMRSWLAGPGGNPSSLHTRGRAARAQLEQARAAVASLLGVTPAGVVLTSGGTEAANLGVLGAARARRLADGRKHVVVSVIEHAAVLEAVACLEREQFEVTRVAVDRQGSINLDGLVAALRPDTALVLVMAVNNETGVVQPVREAAEAAHRVGAYLFCDAVQALGYLDVGVDDLGVDLLGCSAHKIGGPVGAGALYCRSGIALAPLVLGGAQENMRRGGTESVLAHLGFGAAAQALLAHRSEARRAVECVQETLLAGVQASLPEAVLVGTDRPRAPHIATWLLPGVEAETLLYALDLQGIAASSGAACSSHTMEASHVLLGMGYSPEEARSALRLSWGPTTSVEEVEYLLGCLPRLVARNRKATEASRRSLERSRRIRSGDGGYRHEP